MTKQASDEAKQAIIRRMGALWACAAAYAPAPLVDLTDRFLQAFAALPPSGDTAAFVAHWTRERLALLERCEGAYPAQMAAWQSAMAKLSA